MHNNSCFCTSDDVDVAKNIRFHIALTGQPDDSIKAWFLILPTLLKSFNVSMSGNNIEVRDTVAWNSSHDLVLYAAGNITLHKGAKLVSTGKGSVYLKAGMESSDSNNKVLFNDDIPQLILAGGGKAYIHYDPSAPKDEIKYHFPQNYYKHIEPNKALEAYMLIHNVDDLQSVRYFLHGNYALGNDIEASKTQNWNDGQGFKPLYIKDLNIPFSGKFDGNGFSIQGLFINLPDENNVGLFGIIAGQKYYPAVIKDLKLSNSTIIGGHYVGAIAGDTEYALIDNVNVKATIVKGTAIVGGIAGTSKDSVFNKINVSALIEAEEFAGLLLGSGEHLTFNDFEQASCVDAQMKCIGSEIDVTYDA